MGQGYLVFAYFSNIMAVLLLPLVFVTSPFIKYRFANLYY